MERIDVLILVDEYVAVTRPYLVRAHGVFHQPYGKVLEVGVVQPRPAPLFLGVLLFRARRQLQKHARKRLRPRVGKRHFVEPDKPFFGFEVIFFQSIVLVCESLEPVGNPARRRGQVSRILT